MGSAAKTANYELNQWTGNENPKRADFNADNLAIDQALTPTADPAIADEITTNGPFKLVKWVSIFAKLIKAITGKANWYTAPATTIEALNTAMGTKAAASDLTAHLAEKATLSTYGHVKINRGSSDVVPACTTGNITLYVRTD
ncbi:MAG: hypothetical protein GXY34_12280, partial [Syntrophomonadaceae bacterium]|nr:hypothetical protein [Syntrophomonadaceae bacterium]